MNLPSDRTQLQLHHLDLLYLHRYRRTGVSTNDRMRDGFANSCFGYVLKGGATFTAAPRVLRLAVGDLIYIPKGQRYISCWTGKPEVEFYSLNFELRGTTLSGDPFAFQTLRDRGGALRRRFDRLFQRLEARDLLAGLGEFFQLYGLLADRMTPADGRSHPARLAPAIHYLDEHYRDDFNNLQLAELCGLGESQFYATFRSAMGLTPVAYKNRARVERALQLLALGERSVEWISDHLNFSSPSYLRRVLRAHTGLRPKDWRRRAQGLAP